MDVKIVNGLKFFLAASKVWEELKLSDKLETLLREKENIPEDERDPFDSLTNPYFLIEKELRTNLLSKKIITKSEGDHKFVKNFIKMKFIRSFKKDDMHEKDCGGDCANCENGELSKNDNPKGIWN